MGSAKKLVRKSSTLRTINIIGDFWVLLILREAFFGAARYSDIKGALPITHATLTSRLKRMMAANLLARSIEGSGEIGQAYRLTAKGRDLYKILMLLADWEMNWFDAPGKVRSKNLFTHKVCGKKTRPKLVCEHCRNPVDVCDISFEDGPGAGYEFAPPGRMQRQAAISLEEALVSPRILTASAAVIGDRWTAAIIAVTFRRCKRFDEYLDYLKISPHILSSRLSTLIELGLIERKAYQTAPARYDYVLTPMAIDFYPIVIAMGEWGDHWLDEGSGPLIMLHHETCGQRLKTAFSCGTCHEELYLNDINQFRIRSDE